MNTATVQAEETDLLTLKEAMAFLRISRSTAYRMMEAGNLPARKVGRNLRFYRNDLRRCVKERV